MSNIKQTEKDVIFQTYKRLPIVIDKSEAVRIWDTDGNIYLDFLAGIAVNALGHSHPKILDAINEQAKKYLHVSNYFYQEAQIKLAKKITEITGYNKVFFSNSGTEATEAAIKLARKWGNPKSKSKIFGFSGGFHGRTYAALSLMDKPNYKNGMEPFLPDNKVIEINNIQQLEENIGDDTCALILEFIQGEGGLNSPSEQFLDKIAELKDKYGFLLIADEVQSGFGRTGKFFAFQHTKIKPDIITMAKGMGGGLPLGGILANNELASLWEPGNHGTTYGGNALACATGYVVVDELEHGLLDHVNNIGEYFHEKLTGIKDKYSDKVIEVRGRGLMKGLLLNFEAAELVSELLKRKVIANAASGNVLRMVPPLIVQKDDIDEFIDKLDESLSAIQNV